MATFPWKIAAVGGGALILLLALAGDSKADELPPPPPPPPPPPGKRPRRFPGAPAGAGVSGPVAPHLHPGDPAKWANGLLVHQEADQRSPLIAPEGVGSLHADRGDELVLLEVNVPDRSTPQTKRRWAKVITPLGGRGYVSQLDPRDLHPNFDVVQAPQNVEPDVGAPPPGPGFPPPADEFSTIGMNRAAEMAGMAGWPPGMPWDPRFAHMRWDPRFGPPPAPWLLQHIPGGTQIVGNCHAPPPAMPAPVMAARDPARMFGPGNPYRPGLAWRPRG